MLELMPPFYFLSFAKVSVSVSKAFGLEKSLGIGLENIWSRKKVSVSVSKILVSKKSLSIGLDEIFWSRHSVVLTQYLVAYCTWQTCLLFYNKHEFSLRMENAAKSNLTDIGISTYSQVII